MHAAHRFAEENFLHRGALRTLDATTNQIEELLVQAGVIPFTRRGERHQSAIGHPHLNEYSGCVPLIKALTLAGMYPNVAIATGGRGLRTANENFSMIHPTSIHYTNRNDNLPFGSLVTYTTKAKSNDGGTLLLRTITEAKPLMVMLFGGKLIHSGSIVEVDSWLPFQVPVFAARATFDFRLCLDRVCSTFYHQVEKCELTLSFSCLRMLSVVSPREARKMIVFWLTIPPVRLSPVEWLRYETPEPAF
jgi:hypothetical protein